MDINQTPQTNRPIDDDSAPTGATDAAITTWLDTYRPRGKATRVWSQHCDLIKPWIAACSSDGVDEARRNAGTFLNYLAWALDQADSIEDCLSEDMFDRFCEENPAGLTDGSFAHARRRCEKVLAARAAYLTAASVSPTGQTEAAEPTPATNAPAPRQQRRRSPTLRPSTGSRSPVLTPRSRIGAAAVLTTPRSALRSGLWPIRRRASGLPGCGSSTRT